MKRGINQLLTFPSAVRRDPAVDAWFDTRRNELGSIARKWFEVMRNRGSDVRELIHDLMPTACVGDVAFCYVNAFTSHVNVGFFCGSELDDPADLLIGTGKFMRHVKITRDQTGNEAALTDLIETAYRDVKGRLSEQAGGFAPVTRTIEIGAASPFFLVRNVPQTLAFYRDELGFEITYQGPEPDDIFFGIVQRGYAMLMFKDIGVEPEPISKRDAGKGKARWDTYIYVNDPDTLAAELCSRGVEFFQPLIDTHDGLRGFEIRDPNGYVIFFGRPQ